MTDNLDLIKKLETIIGFSLKPQVEFFKKRQKEYLSDEMTTLTFGDLNPSNIIIDSKRKVWLTDFEQACIDNYMSDFAYLWIFLQKYPIWQKKLLELIIKNNHDRDFFRASIIKQIINFGWQNQNEEFFRNNKGHLSLKYLKAAGSSFGAIINTA